MRALVLGATGFVGLNLIDALNAAGVEVRATRRKRSPTLLLARRAVELVDACLEDPAALRAAMTGCDVVFLAAGHYPRYSLDLAGTVHTGVLGVRNACDAALAAGVSKLVYTSSVGALDRAPAGRAADERDVPPAMPTDSAYRAVKWAMEREVERAQSAGLRTATMIPGGCVGPWDVRAGTGALLLGVVRGEMPFWLEGTVNLVDVGDVARAHVRAALGDAPTGARYCLAGHSVRMSWLLPHLAARYGGAAPARRVTLAEARALADEAEREAAPRRARVPVPREFVDLVATGQPVSDARAERELSLTFGPLDAALDRAHAWFTRYRYLPAAPPRRIHDST